MVTESQVRALRLVSYRLRAGNDVAMVSSLLSAAAGDVAVPHTLTSDHVAALREHRVLVLVPSDWSTMAKVNLRQHRLTVARRQLQLYHLLEQVVGLFDEHGIDTRVLKGLATSRLDYERPSQRQTGDVDLLVRPERLRAAINLLVQMGGTGHGLDRAGHNFAKGATLTLPDGHQIDLHTRLTRHSEQSADVLFADGVAIPGSAGRAFPAALRLVHTAAHLLYTPPGHRRLSSLADISAIRSTHDVDLGTARRLASDLGVERVAGAALSLERELRCLPNDLTDWPRPDRLERSSFVREDRRMLMEHTLALRGLSSTSERVRYMRQWALPSTDRLAVRGGVKNYLQRALPARLGGQNLDRAR